MKSPASHLVFALLVCIAALTSYGLWYATVSAKSAAVADLEAKIDAKTKAINRLTATRSALAEIASDESLVQSYFISESGVVGFIDNLQARGQTEGSTVNVLSVSADDTSAQPTLTFSITVKGTFDAIMRTVGAIEYAPYDVSIPMLTVGQDGKTGWHADLTLVVGSLSKSTANSTP